MFAADLSWTDPTHEKVGERRERKQRKREGSICNSQSSGEISRTRSRNYGRIPSIRDAWGFGSSRSGRSSDKSSVAGSVEGRHGKYPSVSTSPTLTTEVPRSIFNKPYSDLKDPAIHPNATYGVKLSQTLPSGASIDPPGYDTIGFGRVTHSRQSSHSTLKLDLTSDPAAKVPSTKATSSDHHLIAPWGFQAHQEPEALCESYDRVKDAVYALQARKTESFAHGYITKQTTVSIMEEEEGDDEASEILSISGERSRLAIHPPRIKKQSSVGAARMSGRSRGIYHAEIRATSVAQHDDDGGRTYLDDESHRTSFSSSVPEFSISSGISGDHGSIGQPWVREHSHDTNDASTEPHAHHDLPDASVATTDVGSDTTAVDLPAGSLFDPVSKRDSTMPMTANAFSRFVQRIESAGASMILERLKEDVVDSADQLEKHLWSLTALQLRSLGRFEQLHKVRGHGHPMPPMPRVTRRRATILEIDGNPAETYQLAAIYPQSTIHHLYLTTSPLHRYTVCTGPSSRQSSASVAPPLFSPLPLPPQVTPLTTASLLPLPFPPSTIHHVRSSALPALVPSSQLPSLLADIHRVLLPNGSLELRVVDPMPVRGTAGPKLRAWLEDRLAMGLESNFRCQRPAQLFPAWISQAGLRIVPARDLEQQQLDDGTLYLQGSSCEASISSFPAISDAIPVAGRSTTQRGYCEDAPGERDTGMVRLFRIPAVVGGRLSAQMSIGLNIGADAGSAKREQWQAASGPGPGAISAARTAAALEEVQEEPFQGDPVVLSEDATGSPSSPSSSSPPSKLSRRDEYRRRKENEAVETEVSVLVLRELWRNCWGGFVEPPLDPRSHRPLHRNSDEGSSSEDEVDMQWWWEDEDIIVECRDWETAWEIGTIWAVKD